MTTCVHDECPGLWYPFYFLEQEELFFAVSNQRAAGMFRTRDALFTSAISAGIPARRAARFRPGERSSRKLDPECAASRSRATTSS